MAKNTLTTAEPKWALFARGFWGPLSGLLVALAAILHQLFPSLPNLGEDILSLTPQVDAAIDTLLVIVFNIVGMWGRVKATRPATLLPPG